jgi:glycosyltransferase involved in cell wall biosynthesis
LKTLIIHNTLWAHYKSVLFEEIAKQYPPEGEFHVLQIAKSEVSRKGMEGEGKTYTYPYTLLFDGFIEEVPKWKELQRVFQFILQYKPDIINVTGYSSSFSTLPTIFFARLLGIKVVMSNESTQKDKTRSWLKESIKKWAVQACKGFVVFGKTSEDYVLDLGAKPEQILVHKGAVVDNKVLSSVYHKAKETTLYPEITTQKNFIYVGRMAEEKNVELLIKCFQQLNEQEWGLILVGKGPKDQEIDQLIAKSPDRIYKYPPVHWMEVPKFFSRSSCFVLPSTSEPWGLVVNEAMVCGLPVIVTDVCGCSPDLVNGNGVVIPSNSASALISALKKIISTPDLTEMENKSLEIIKDFSVQEVAKRYIQGIQSL